MRHLLPGVSEGVPAEGLLGRALQLRHRLHARARWEYLFFTQRQERQSQDRVAVQLRVAGESRSCTVCCGFIACFCVWEDLVVYQFLQLLLLQLLD